MEISNKTLALFLVGAIVVSLAGTIVSLNKLNSLSTTGFVTDTGTANLSVSTLTSIKFAIDAVDFGTGYVNTSLPTDRCILTINATSAIARIGCENFNSVNAAGGDTFIIENDGNRFLNVSLNSSDNADDLVGGTGGTNSFMWTIDNNESSSCAGTLPLGAWTEIDKVNTIVCSNLSFTTASDSLRVGINITIPDNSNTGVTSATLTATGAAI